MSAIRFYRASWDTLERRQRRARRLAARHGFRLMKSYARRPTDPTYERYQILDIGAGRVVAGRGDASLGYALTFEDAEKWLKDATSGDPKP